MEFIREANLWLAPLLALLYLVRYRTLGWDYKYFTMTLVTYGVFTLLMDFYVILTNGGNNIFFFLPYLLLEFITLTFFYSQVLKNKKIRWLLVPVLLFLSIQYLIEPNLFYRFNMLGVFISHVILIALSLIYMYKCLTEPGPFSIINLGIFVYFVPVTVVFVSGNLATEGDIYEKLSLFFNRIHEIVYFLFHLLVLEEWWRNFYRVKTK